MKAIIFVTLLFAISLQTSRFLTSEVSQADNNSCEVQLQKMNFMGQLNDMILNGQTDSISDLLNQALEKCDTITPMLTNLIGFTKNSFVKFNEVNDVSSAMSLAQELMTQFENMKDQVAQLGNTMANKCVKEFMQGVAKFGVLVGRLAIGKNDDSFKALTNLAWETLPMVIKCYTPF